MHADSSVDKETLRLYKEDLTVTSLCLSPELAIRVRPHPRPIVDGNRREP